MIFILLYVRICTAQENNSISYASKVAWLDVDSDLNILIRDNGINTGMWIEFHQEQIDISTLLSTL